MYLPIRIDGRCHDYGYKKPTETSHLARVTSGFPLILLVSMIERKKWKYYCLKIRVHTESCRKKGK